MVVDDDELVRRMMCRALRPAHDVIEACDGAEALAAMRAHPMGFDLVLCDLEMPRMDGASLCAELEASMPEVLDDVVIVTGGAHTRRLQQFVAQREPFVLHKPFDFDALRELARRRVAARRRMT